MNLQVTSIVCVSFFRNISPVGGESNSSDAYESATVHSVLHPKEYVNSKDEHPGTGIPAANLCPL